MTALQDSSVIKMKKVLFVCTGNTCRSPMAEAIFNELSKSKNDFHAKSCGIFADGVSPISDNAKAALAENGINSDHTSTPITEEHIQMADYVIGMTGNHANQLSYMFPQYKNKIYAMPKDIFDPYCGNIDVYRNCRNEIETCIKMLIDALEKENEN